MRTAAALLLAAGLLVWGTLHPLDRRRRASPVLVVMGVVVVLLSLRAPAEARFDPVIPEVAAVPDVYGWAPEAAAAELTGAGFDARVVRSCSAGGTGDRVEQVFRLERSPWWSLTTPLVTDDGTTAAGSAQKTGSTLLLRVPDSSVC